MSSSNQNWWNRLTQGVIRFLGGDSQWMRVCLNLETGLGCKAENGAQEEFCWKCGNFLRNTLQVLRRGVRVEEYEIVGLVGYGGYGAVYEALDVRRVGRRVALKQSFNPDHIKSFGYEFDVLRELTHANLPRYEEMFQVDHHGYLVMEFVAGKSLWQILQEQGAPLPESLVSGYAVQLCDLLTYLHTYHQPQVGLMPILHRDIKPENIRLTAHGLIKLVDFGLLKQGAGHTRTSRIAWTPGYAPLEQSPTSKERTTVRSDIYSLGATLYHLLTGKVPMNALERLIELPDDPLLSPKLHNPALSPHIAEAIMQAMQLKQAARYADANAFKRALLALPAGTTPVVAPAAEEERPQTRSRRRQQRAAAPTRTPEKEESRQPPPKRKGKKASPNAPTVKRKSDPKPEPANVPPAKRAVRRNKPVERNLYQEHPEPAPLPVRKLLLAAKPIVITPKKLGIGSERVGAKDGMVQVYVPAGEFLMGSRDDDSDAYDDEKPQHPVHLDAYWIDKTPVTNAMFAKFVAETHYVTEAEKKGNAWGWTGSKWEQITGAQWRHPRGPNSNLSGKDNHPVVSVSWNDAVAYAKWAERRLPTEAEWEKAAGGVLTEEGTRKWPWGNEPPTDKLCNFGMNVGDTTPVGKYLASASPVGALDMAGNVWQWCHDTYSASYYASSPKANPQGPKPQSTKVLRGGSWASSVPITRARNRNWLVAYNRVDYGGFRCAHSPI